MPLFTDERNCKITSVVNFTPSKFGSLPQGVLKVRITKPCTHLHQDSSTFTQFHPDPSTSTQLIWASTQLSATPSTMFEPKYCMWLGNFPKFRPKHSKLSILTENWHTWYLKDADSYSNINFLKFGPKNQFLGKFGPKKSKLSFLSKNWHT